MGKKQHPLRIKEIGWDEYGYAYMSKGHHDPQAFCDAANEIKHKLADPFQPAAVKHEYWRYYPWESYGDYDGSYVEATPGRGAFPVTYLVADEG